jgi:hypothetical protein
MYPVSGHYQRMGVNVQAVVDHYGRFLYVAVAAPGGQPDVNALARISLVDILAALPLGYFVVGNNAYPPSEGLVPVFGGNDQNIMANDDANFFMSQCRIRVEEMAFGMMTNRFGILQSPLRDSPLHLGTLMQCVARLHTFMLTQNNDYNSYLTEEVRSFSPPTRDEEQGRETNGDKVEAIAGVSLMRDKIVRRVREAGLRRPPR